jgi:hypothetical protein
MSYDPIVRLSAENIEREQAESSELGDDKLDTERLGFRRETQHSLLNIM